MLKSKRFWVIFICLVCTIAGLVAAGDSSRKPSETNIYEIADVILNALGEDYKLQTITQPLAYRYADKDGNTIVYYLCVTDYGETAPPDAAVLNMDAIHSVFDPDTAKEVQEASINNCPGTFFHTGGLSYLCWTMTPHISCVLEYDPAITSEADIRRMAKSVPLVTE